MNSEKVKEIKKALEYAIDMGLVMGKNTMFVNIKLSDILTLINELESENERLKWGKQTLEDKDTLLAKVGEMVQENQQLKDRIADLESELEKEQINNLNCDTELQYKEKRIAELEKENERLKNRITCQVVIPNDKLEEIKKECLKKVEVDKDKSLKQFAERLKAMAYQSTDWSHGVHPMVVEVDYIDEILEEITEDKV